MFNLLPEKEKKEIRKQYRIRKFIVILIFLSFIMVASLIFVIPSYILTIYKVQEIEREIESVQALLDQKNRSELTMQLEELGRKIEVIAKGGSNPQFYDLISKVLLEKPAGVRVEGILLQGEIIDDELVYRIQLTGVADTRGVIVQYTDILDSSGVYEGVSLPIESLASQYNTPFTLNFTFTL